jgi:hypothetical protein
MPHSTLRHEFLTVNPNATGLDDPKPAGDRLGVQHPQQIAHELFQQTQ